MENKFSKTKDQSIGYHFWKASVAWQREIKKELNKFNLTHTQFVILANLLDLKKQQVNQELLSRETNIDKMTLSSTIRLLEKKNLVTRYNLENNKKNIYLKITKEAENVMKDTIPKVEQIDINFFGSLENKNIFLKELQNLQRN